MRLRPTRRLPGMAFAALVIYVFATNSQVIWLYLVAALVAGLAVVGVAAPWLTLRRLRPQLQGHTRTGFVAPLAQDRTRVFVGDVVSLRIDLGEGRSPVELTSVHGPGGALVPIDGQQTDGAGITARVRAAHRGEMRLEKVTVASSWPLGVSRAERDVDLQFAVVVHPLYGIRPAARRQGRREEAGASSVRGDGEEFLGLREYRSGDSRRRVHWPTTARTGKLMVVETARESSNSNAYALDLSEGNLAAVELAVQVAASLAAGNVAAGVPLTMSVPGHPRHVQRWSEVLSALAMARSSDPGAGREPRDALRIRAAGGQVLVGRAQTSSVLEADDTLEAALRTLALS